MTRPSREQIALDALTARVLSDLANEIEAPPLGSTFTSVRRSKALRRAIARLGESSTDEQLAEEAARFANQQKGYPHRPGDGALMLEAVERQWDRAGEDPWLLIGRDYIAGARREGRTDVTPHDTDVIP